MARSRTQPPAPYQVHPSVAHARAIVANLEATTGKPLAAWLELLRRAAPGDERAARRWLMAEHGLGIGTAIRIAEHARPGGSRSDDPAAYLEDAPTWVDAQYAGPRAALRPTFEAVLTAARALGPDVMVCPMETVVSLIRNHVFAQLRPTTRTRIDLALALKGARGRLPARLLPLTGASAGDRLTHRLGLTRPEDLDPVALSWLAKAHALDA